MGGSPGTGWRLRVTHRRPRDPGGVARPVTGGCGRGRGRPLLRRRRAFVLAGRAHVRGRARLRVPRNVASRPCHPYCFSGRPMSTQTCSNPGAGALPAIPVRYRSAPEVPIGRGRLGEGRGTLGVRSDRRTAGSRGRGRCTTAISPGSTTATGALTRWYGNSPSSRSSSCRSCPRVRRFRRFAPHARLSISGSSARESSRRPTAASGRRAWMTPQGPRRRNTAIIPAAAAGTTSLSRRSPT